MLMRVCMSRRAMSKWLCFIASMPRSNRTLSGCLESTLANGLLTFLLVHAVVSASVAARAITVIRKDMKTSKEKFLSFRTALAVRNLLLLVPINSRTRASALHFLQRRLERCLQQILGINHWNFCPGPYYLCHGVKRHPAVDFDPVIQVSLFA